MSSKALLRSFLILFLCFGIAEPASALWGLSKGSKKSKGKGRKQEKRGKDGLTRKERAVKRLWEKDTKRDIKREDRDLKRVEIKLNKLERTYRDHPRAVEHMRYKLSSDKSKLRNIEIEERSLLKRAENGDREAGIKFNALRRERKELEISIAKDGKFLRKANYLKSDVDREKRERSYFNKKLEVDKKHLRDIENNKVKFKTGWATKLKYKAQRAKRFASYKAHKTKVFTRSKGLRAKRFAKEKAIYAKNKARKASRYAKEKAKKASRYAKEKAKKAKRIFIKNAKRLVERSKKISSNIKKVLNKAKGSLKKVWNSVRKESKKLNERFKEAKDNFGGNALETARQVPILSNLLDKTAKVQNDMRRTYKNIKDLKRAVVPGILQQDEEKSEGSEAEISVESQQESAYDPGGEDEWQNYTLGDESDWESEGEDSEGDEPEGDSEGYPEGDEPEGDSEGYPEGDSEGD